MEIRNLYASPTCSSVEMLTEEALLVGSPLEGIEAEDFTKTDDSSNWI